MMVSSFPNSITEKIFPLLYILHSFFQKLIDRMYTWVYFWTLLRWAISFYANTVLFWLLYVCNIFEGTFQMALVVMQVI